MPSVTIRWPCPLSSRVAALASPHERIEWIRHECCQLSAWETRRVSLFPSCRKRESQYLLNEILILRIQGLLTAHFAVLCGDAVYGGIVWVSVLARFSLRQNSSLCRTSAATLAVVAF